MDMLNSDTFQILFCHIKCRKTRLIKTYGGGGGDGDGGSVFVGLNPMVLL